MQAPPPGRPGILSAAVVLSIALTALAAQQPAPAHEVAVLVDGLGTYGRRLATESVQAQKFFDQGLRLIYGYYFPEAIASFQEALRHDPEHPMIHWGLAMAMAPNPNSRYTGFRDDPRGKGRKAIAAARARAGRASPVERALIDALFVRFDADAHPSRAERDDKYVEAARSVRDRFPDDLEAGFCYAEALMTRSAWTYWRRDGSPLPGASEAAAALEHVMKLEPNHPGAVHLYIHLFESSAQPQRALPQADRLESLMPNAGHVVHMPSDIYIRLGHYEKAIATNERSIAADRFFVKAWGDHPYPDTGTYALSARVHPPHVLDFVRYAATLQGNYAQAIGAARAAAASERPERHHLGSAQRRLATVWLVHKVFGKWDQLLAEPAPGESAPSQDGMWRYARGSALVGRGEVAKAQEELTRLQAVAGNPAMNDLLAMANPASRVLALAARALEGEIARASGKPDAAVSAFSAAVQLQDGLNYMEPPDWGQSMRLYLGAALLEAGRPRDAEKVYREDLQEFRENGWALFGLWQALRDQRRTAEAADVRQRFERAWKDADVTLSASVL